MKPKTLALSGAGTACIALGYAAWCAAPGIFVGKGVSPERARRLTVVAHRGGSGIAPENTLAAMECGIASGADMLEIDIHQTADGILVVCHDPTVDRTTDGHGKISRMTLREIRELHIVDKCGKVTDQHIPTLDEVMALVGDRARLLIEVKHARGEYPGIERRLVETIRSHEAEERVTVQSFNDEVLLTTHKLAPRLRLEKLLICRMRGLPLIIDTGLSRFDYDRYSHVSSFNFYSGAVTRGLIDDMHAHGKEVKIWTLDSPASAPDLPVDGIITDRPDLWR